MAKTEQYTAEQMITAIQLSKGLVSYAARKLGCHPDTVRTYAKRYASVRDALNEARYAMTDTAELSLFDQVVKGEAWAVQFYLKTQGKNRGYVERQEITGTDGGAVVVKVLGGAARMDDL